MVNNKSDDEGEETRKRAPWKQYDVVLNYNQLHKLSRKNSLCKTKMVCLTCSGAVE